MARVTAPAPVPPALADAREQFLTLVDGLRPELHRYAARLTGSVIEGEDIVQDTLAKAFYALSLSAEVPQLRPWLFRIAHNAALDFLKSHGRRYTQPDADIEDTAGYEDRPDPAVVRAALARFVGLPVTQRSAVILKDVLGHSLEETAETMGTTVMAVKAALVRGRGKLLEEEPDAVVLEATTRAELQRYASLFNARDWDGVRALVSDDCRLDLVGKSQRRGKQVGAYFGRYEKEDVALKVVRLSGALAFGAYVAGACRPAYFILLELDGGRVTSIRDFRYVPYIAAEAELEVLATMPNREQIELWNGPRGEFWVTEQELRDRELAFFGDATLAAAAAVAGDRVVDVGCGCGATTLALAAAVGPRGSVLGVDVSRPMLARAAERSVGLSQVRLEAADAATFPFDGSANAVVSRFGVMFFDDPRAAFTNLRGALRHGGKLAFVCWRSLAKNGWMNVAFEAVRPLVPSSVVTPRADAAGPLAFADPARVRSILEGAGFSDVSLEPLDHPMPLGGNRGLDAAAADALTVGPTARLLLDASEELRAKALAAARGALQPFVRGDSVELRGAAWLVTARSA